MEWNSVLGMDQLEFNLFDFLKTMADDHFAAVECVVDRSRECTSMVANVGSTTNLLLL